MKQLFIYLISLLVCNNTYSQNNEKLKIIDLSQLQIRLLNQYKNVDSITKSKIYLDSIYRPYRQFWEGYAGDESSFTSWMCQEGVQFLDFLNKKNQQISGEKLLKQFLNAKENMYTLTGYMPKGEWFIVYSHGATNLGGLGTGEMVIDLSHENNSSNENIMAFFPHEITHQIMNNVNRNTDTTAISSIIGEGFAVYVNQLYWAEKYTLAQNLDYTEAELKQCKKYKKLINQFFESNKFSSDKSVLTTFRSRTKKIHPELPGAIGYYIGYEIIKKYVKKSSWKDVFTKSPKVIYELSGY
ncbi:MAG: hypothetical protein IPP72_03045 [Chitinophagaceae bacterium]|nr:hypothetical protein [Chitinophagaceae bacterium]